MADPVSWIAIASSAVGAVGSIYQGNAAASQANYQARVAEQNQTTARQQANAKEELIRRQNARQLGEQRAAAAQSGFDPSSGSLLRIQGESAGNTELDALTARYEGQMQALSFGNEAAGLRTQAKSARTSGLLNAAGSLLGSAARYGGSQSLMPKTPMPLTAGLVQ
jgi:hypothetical protein